MDGRRRAAILPVRTYKGIPNAAVKRAIAMFLATGASQHSGNATMLQYVIDYCEQNKIPYCLKADPAYGYSIVQMDPIIRMEPYMSHGEPKTTKAIQSLPTTDRNARRVGKNPQDRLATQASGRAPLLASAIHGVHGILRRAEQANLTTVREDLALRTVFEAVRTMYEFLQELSQDNSLCDCADRSWYGKGHDSQCPAEQITNLLGQLGDLGRNQYYVLFIDGDVDPFLHGPFATEQQRDAVAKQLREEDDQDPKSGIYRLDCAPAPRVNAYSGAFFED